MPTILIVEDNEDIRLNLVEYLESKNYQTDNTDDGLKALALTIVNKYDLIVLDIMIPGMDGLRLCRELRMAIIRFCSLLHAAKMMTSFAVSG